MRHPDVPHLERGDVVAVRRAPGPSWRALVATAWGAGAALLPVDTRSPAGEASALLAAARPTLVGDGDGWTRPAGGLPADGEVAIIIATSGSAGQPRLVELTRLSVESAVRASTGALAAGAGDGWLACLPLSHIGGLLVVLRAVLLELPLVIHRRFDPAATAAVVARGDAVFTSMVPTMLARLLEVDADLSGCRGILLGGSGLDVRLRARARERSLPVVPTYGQTQSCGGVVYDGLPLPGVSVRIPQDGEIQLTGATIMRGYRLDPAATAAAFTADGWLRTGDMGEIDAQGRLHVEGRRDDVIVTGGEKVWPAPVEAVLREHPAVADVAVIGRPDPEWGERVVALVVPAGPAPPSVEGLRDLVAERLPRYHAPRELVLVRSLPRTALGKVRRPLLR